MKLSIPLTSPWKDLLAHGLLLAGILGLVALAHFGSRNPDTTAALERAYPGQLPVIVSARYATGPQHSTGRVSYVLLPSFFAHSRLVTAERRNAEPVRLSESGAVPFPVLALLVLAPAVPYFRGRWRCRRAGPNNSSKPTPLRGAA
ncbi:hypothetical protein [Cognatilysobacter lacus]|uniref:Uncharacterized protein n=1 Tax=Cognatilysobacter lacus TaxID=1643323 RepID=A0A5D8YYI5_9GAMM|nr:hypothetical protein [Lysobacter lacus]TZF87785.1 hypothetical protein FW784_10700 [Lysobacter lacus]